MDYRPDQDDFERPLKPIKASGRRLPAAIPIALAGLIALSGVAFGATVIRTITDADATPVVLDDDPDATPVVLGDDPTDAPTDAPTAEPTEAPTEAPTEEPTPATMTLTATLSGTKVVLTWSAFQGEDFAYYKVVRSTNAEVTWPLGTGDKLVAAISDQNKLTFTDTAPLGKTLYYRIFAVRSSTEGYEAMGSTNVATIATPEPTAKPTPRPTPTCGMSLSYRIVTGDGGAKGVKLTWTKYRCDHFQYYVPGRSADSDVDFPLPHANTTPLSEIGDVTVLTFTDWGVESGKTYWYRVMAWNEEVFCNGGTVLAKTNRIRVTIP